MGRTGKLTKADMSTIRRALDRGVAVDEAIRLGFVASGAAGLPLTDRDVAWSATDAESSVRKWASSDGSGDLDKVDWGKYGQAFFWHDTNPSGVGDFKLGFARNDGGLEAVWRGVTAVAAVLSGSRGGVQGVSADDVTAIKGKVSSYYAAARKKYNDDSIQPPWESTIQDGIDLCIDNVEAHTRVEEMADDEFFALVGRFAIEMGDATDPMMQKLAEVADTIDHCPDYGEVYWNETTGDVWWEGCDGDQATQGEGATVPADSSTGGTTSADEIKERFMAVDGVKSVTIEAETPPPDTGDYVQVPQSEASDDDTDDGDSSDDDGPPLPADMTAPLDGDGLRVLSPYADVDAPVAGADDEDDADAAEGDGTVPDSDGVPFKATLAVEGVPTDDGRVIAPGALTWRDLPLTLMAIIEDSHGGMPTTRTVVAGRIDQIERDQVSDGVNEIVGTGVFDTGDQGAEIARLVGEKMMRGVSIDMAPKKVEEIWGDEAESQGGIEDPFFGESYLMRVLEGVILGATVCPFAAFGDADIETVTASGARLAGFMLVPTGWTTDGAVRRMRVLGRFQDEPADGLPPADTTDFDTQGGIIALYPQDSEVAAIADPDQNIDASALHVTLFRFPAMPDADTLTQLVTQFAEGYAKLSGTVGGYGVLTPNAPSDDDDDDQAGKTADVLIVDAPGLGEMRFDLADALEDNQIPYGESHDFVPHITFDYADEDNDMPDLASIAQAAPPLTFTAISIIADDGTRVDVPLAAELTASGAGMVPDLPPGAWFDYPADVCDGEHLVPLTVSGDGRVYGHIAVFNQCHTGMRDQCVTAPHHFRPVDGSTLCAVCGEREKLSRHSRAEYDYFHLGEIETAEGDLVKVGQITIAGSHADHRGDLSARQVQAHYDNTSTAVCDVHVYEDSVGVMAAGALRPDVPVAKVRELRASKPSGDWRPIRGRLELMAVLGVNMPGFPVPRVTTRIDEEETRELAMVAAGVPDYDKAGEAVCSDVDEEIAELVARARLPMLLRRARR